MKTVLWIEDDPEVMGGLGSAFKRADFSVRTALDIKSALEIVEDNDFDCIVVDMALDYAPRARSEGAAAEDLISAVEGRNKSLKTGQVTQIVLLTSFVQRAKDLESKHPGVSVLSKLDLHEHLGSLMAGIRRGRAAS